MRLSRSRKEHNMFERLQALSGYVLLQTALFVFMHEAM